MLKKPYLIIIFFLCISFVLIESLIILNSFTDDDLPVDYVVVLGAGLFGDQPSPSLYYRLEKALKYANKYPYTPIVVSGGQGPDEWIPEAEAMKLFLVQNGIDEKRIIVESNSTSTQENFLFTKSVIPKEGESDNPTVMIITSEYHMFRSKLLARRNGFIPYGICAPTPAFPKYLKPLYYLREYFAVIKSFFFD
ncbi:MAG TPA: YdcF family protein [Thermoanaerobacterales bacterium]|nr:YdcF family protein [Thermoanaerobacterales bacterium]